MFQHFDEVQHYLKEHVFQAVDLKFCDLWGRWHHLTLPAKQFTPAIMEAGIGFDGSSVGLKTVKSGDMVMTPDLGTAFEDPFWEEKTLSFICTTLDAETNEIFVNDPRNLARQSEAYLRSTGIATESRWGPEFEFYIFEEAAYENEINSAGYRLNSAEAEWNSMESAQGSYIPLHGGYHASPPKDRYYNLRATIAQQMDASGIAVKYHHHEVGSPGQQEIEIPMMGLVKAADAVMLAKYITKMVAFQDDKVATFMPKPLHGEAGNGMHVHQHLFEGDTNLFYDPNGYGYLSDTARYYLGGLLYHGAAVLALTNPSTNSYRRLVPGYEAPVNAFYSLGNRSAAIRIPKYAKQPETARFEFRPPDATCNPYLALAVQLMAGIDGIQKKMDPTELGFGPIEEDAFSWTDEQRAAIKPLPTSLDEALEALEKDYEFLLAGNVFSEELIENWVEHKRENEVAPVRNRPHPYEMSLYFDV
ncbi:MAG: type I glutamate--ammonia ligase [Anaerolineae bacterium]|jgi:glutamine synthetase|nr:type I glutamate--ammonia ligase [Anaerolineae bacterium]MBT7326897.1 type I glutamate--ammonia ligase [Anaerolineae bacterium]